VYCIVLYCIVLYCTVLYCTVLYCTVLSAVAVQHLPGCQWGNALKYKVASKVVMCFILTTDKNKNDRKEGSWRDGCVIKYHVTPGGQ
jgi:hypothetical protein